MRGIKDTTGIVTFEKYLVEPDCVFLFISLKSEFWGSIILLQHITLLNSLMNTSHYLYNY